MQVVLRQRQLCFLDQHAGPVFLLLFDVLAVLCLLDARLFFLYLFAGFPCRVYFTDQGIRLVCRVECRGQLQTLHGDIQLFMLHGILAMFEQLV